MDSTQIDTIIEARWIIPAEPYGLELENHAIAIDKGVIQAVLPASEISRQFSPVEHIVLPQHVLIPGLINLHTHAAMALLRGLADGLPLMEWLNDHIWPAEIKHVNEDFVLDGTNLACIEMLKGGTTCFNDMYFFPKESAKAVLASGMRGAIGMLTIDFPTAYANDSEDYLARGLAMRDEYRHYPLLSFCFAPHAPYTVSDKTLISILTYAEQLDLPVHMRLHETEAEIKHSLENFGIRPLARLHQLGLLSPGLIGVNMIHLAEEEIELIGSQGCSVAHCPSSNLKLANGYSPVSALLRQGINVGLGTDGAASNNRLDMFGEMRLTALLAKGQSNRADELPAYQALQMATLNGAKALGLGDRIGSLVKGKMADITAVDFSAPELSPCYDPVSHLVYSAGREHVSNVWVDGKILVKEGKLTTLNEQEISAKALFWENRIKIKKNG